MSLNSIRALGIWYKEFGSLWRFPSRVKATCATNLPCTPATPPYPPPGAEPNESPRAIQSRRSRCRSRDPAPSRYATVHARLITRPRCPATPPSAERGHSLGTTTIWPSVAGGRYERDEYHSDVDGRTLQYRTRPLLRPVTAMCSLSPAVPLRCNPLLPTIGL